MPAIKTWWAVKTIRNIMPSSEFVANSFRGLRGLSLLDFFHHRPLELIFDVSHVFLVPIIGPFIGDGSINTTSKNAFVTKQPHIVGKDLAVITLIPSVVQHKPVNVVGVAFVAFKFMHTGKNVITG